MEPSADGPILAIIAGPNGSGKSEFYRRFLRPQFSVYVNADEIAVQLTGVSDKERNLVAAHRAEAQRHLLLQSRTSFAFETVFSRKSHWIDFINLAKKNRYRVELYFVCTESPALNVTRIQVRVEKGGHNVDPDKVNKRYPGSIETALFAKPIVDELLLYDNTQQDQLPRLLARFVNGVSSYIAEDMREWALPFLI